MDMSCQQSKNQAHETLEHAKYKPLVLSGCSGAGKGTLVKKLLAKYPQLFELSISLTTRNPRQGEQHGRQYYFVKKEEFQQVFLSLKKEIAKNIFAEYCEVHGNYYGTSKDKVNDMINRGKIAILEIDLQGGQKVNKSGLDCQYLFIDIPSLEILRQRLTGRGTQTVEVINKRMKNAQGELQHVSRLGFYHRIMNDDLQTCFKDVCQFIEKQYKIELN